MHTQTDRQHAGVGTVFMEAKNVWAAYSTGRDQCPLSGVQRRPLL